MKTIILIFILLFIIPTNAQWDIGDLITEYEQECYADSSWELVYVEKQTGYGDLFYTEPCYKWVHKEPTWDEFREFIKKKYQKMLGVENFN